MRLSRRTIPRLAQMICGSHGSTGGFEWPSFPYRSSWYLTQFFYEDCCLPYRHDGSTRITWVTNVLKELNEGKASDPDLPPDDLITVIRELLTSVELDCPENHQGAMDDVNRILAKDNLRVLYENGQYTLLKTDKPRSLVQPTALKEALEDFIRYVATEMRMSFWRFDKTSDKYKWISRPEQYAKNLLLTFLNGRFGESVYTFEEIRAGAGKIDVYIALPKGEKIITELKICGHGYSETYAREGLEQLAHYMENKETDNGFLIVFDSRVRDFSKGFRETESVNGVIITVKITDCRPYVKLKNAPRDV